MLCRGLTHVSFRQDACVRESLLCMYCRACTAVHECNALHVCCACTVVGILAADISALYV